jgi:hypothetical protein
MKLAAAVCLALGSVLCLSVAACKRESAPDPIQVRPPVPTAAPDLTGATKEIVASLEIESKPELEPDWRAVLEPLGAPSLVTWREADSGCRWAVLEPPEFVERVFLVSYRCPYYPVWDKRGGQTLFAIDGRIYLHDWRGAKVSALGASPMAVNGEPQLGFSATGTVRFCNYEDRPEPGGMVAEYTITWERRGEVWKKIRESKFDQALPAQTCSGPQDLERTGSVFYSPRARVPSNCLADRVSSFAEVCPGQQSIEYVKSQVTRPHDGFEFLAWSDQSFLAYPYIVGDSVHAMAPVFAIEGDEVTRIYDRRRGSSQQWGILLGEDHFLVRDEISLTHASLFKKGQVTPVIEFPDDVRVIWIPGTIPIAPVIRVTQ